MAFVSSTTISADYQLFITKPHFQLFITWLSYTCPTENLLWSLKFLLSEANCFSLHWAKSPLTILGGEKTPYFRKLLILMVSMPRNRFIMKTEGCFKLSFTLFNAWFVFKYLVEHEEHNPVHAQLIFSRSMRELNGLWSNLCLLPFNPT